MSSGLGLNARPLRARRKKSKPVREVTDLREVSQFVDFVGYDSNHAMKKRHDRNRTPRNLDTTKNAPGHIERVQWDRENEINGRFLFLRSVEPWSALVEPSEHFA